MTTRRCSVHGLPDCSALLNGCTRLTESWESLYGPTLAEKAAEAATDQGDVPDDGEDDDPWA